MLMKQFLCLDLGAWISPDLDAITIRHRIVEEKEIGGTGQGGDVLEMDATRADKDPSGSLR